MSTHKFMIIVFSDPKSYSALIAIHDVVGPLFSISSCRWILIECSANRREDLPPIDNKQDPASDLEETHRRQGCGHDERKRDMRETQQCHH